ncbi:MAG TPA: hypothetical protein VK176_16655 [Phycisphaerales bacterium]|nr:hypothetical protein [Phycisphaerales bacterium]
MNSESLTRAVASATLALIAPVVCASVTTYDFAGSTNVGGKTRQFTGVASYENSVSPHTVYFNGNTGPLQQGFRSSYFGSVIQLSISLQGGESVTTAAGGYVDVNNIQQAEPGSQVPDGLTAQIYAGPASGTINGIAISTLYLAFLPIQPSFSWDGLDSYLGGNAESMLQDNPGLLPSNIDPALTGTELDSNIALLAPSVFLGTIHHSSQGTTTTVNSITSFELRVPSPSAALPLATLSAVCLRRRRRLL